MGHDADFAVRWPGRCVSRPGREGNGSHRVTVTADVVVRCLAHRTDAAGDRPTLALPAPAAPTDGPDDARRRVDPESP